MQGCDGWSAQNGLARKREVEWPCAHDEPPDHRLGSLMVSRVSCEVEKFEKQAVAELCQVARLLSLSRDLLRLAKRSLRIPCPSPLPPAARPLAVSCSSPEKARKAHANLA